VEVRREKRKSYKERWRKKQQKVVSRGGRVLILRVLVQKGGGVKEKVNLGKIKRTWRGKQKRQWYKNSRQLTEQTVKRKSREKIENIFVLGEW